MEPKPKISASLAIKRGNEYIFIIESRPQNKEKTLYDDEIHMYGGKKEPNESIKRTVCREFVEEFFETEFTSRGRRRLMEFQAKMEEEEMEEDESFSNTLGINSFFTLDIERIKDPSIREVFENIESHFAPKDKVKSLFLWRPCHNLESIGIKISGLAKFYMKKVISYQADDICLEGY